MLNNILFFSFQSMPLLRLVAHMLIGVLFGYLYRNVGNDADSALGNYIYLYGTMLLLVYTGKMSVTLNCEYILNCDWKYE